VKIAFKAAATLALVGGLMLGCSSSDSTDSGTPSPESTMEEMIVDITAEQMTFAEELIAAQLSEDAATALIEEAGYTWRIGSVDGDNRPLTMDYRTDRLTLTIDDGVVTDATWG
jgi:hypothetical protein